MGRRITTQDITWFLDLDRNTQLIVDPPYQRNSVWTPKDRRFFLDTIFSNFPSPAIFLHKELTPDGRAVYNVVDGKQRIETILKFSRSQISIGADFNDSRLNGKKWKDISEDDLKHRFWDYQLNVEFVDNIDNTLVNSIFERLNRNSRKLSRQEMRHAKYEGWLITILEDEVDKIFWKKFGISTNTRTKRMTDVQFVSELMGIVIDEKYVGFDQDYLDELYARFEDAEDIDSNYTPDRILEKLESAKAIIQKIEELNDSITKFADTFTHFYTLWSVVVMKDILNISVEDLADLYLNFMSAVKSYDPSNATDADPLVVEYAISAQGASTEYPQRAARFIALSSALGL